MWRFQARGRPLPEPQQCRIQVESTYSNAGSLTHWTKPGIESTSSWLLVGVVSAEPRWELQSHRLKKLCSLWLPQLMDTAQSPSCKGAILCSSHCLKLPLFSSLLVPFSFYFTFLSYYIPALFTFLLMPILECLNCTLQELFSGTLNFFKSLFAYIRLTAHIH